MIGALLKDSRRVWHLMRAGRSNIATPTQLILGQSCLSNYEQNVMGLGAAADPLGDWIVTANRLGVSAELERFDIKKEDLTQIERH